MKCEKHPFLYLMLQQALVYEHSVRSKAFSLPRYPFRPRSRPPTKLLMTEA